MSARLDQRLRVSAVLVLIGLLVELVSFTWHSPLSFVLFVAIGGLAMATGILLFLYSIVANSKSGD